MIILTTEGLLDAMICFFQGAGDQRWVTKNTPKTPQFHPKAPSQHCFWKNAPQICQKCAGPDCAGQRAETFHTIQKSFPPLPQKKTGWKVMDRQKLLMTHPITELACS